MRELLQEMRVLDFTTNVAGPVSTAMLADYGATVIKVERPGGGDDNRNFPPMLDGQGFIHFWCNRGKKSITLNLNDAEGVAIVKRLVANCDVVVESYRPGIMKKFGLDYDSLAQIKPTLIYCSVSAYGLVGPYAKRPGYDLIAQAMSGQMDLNGEADGAPMKSGMTLGDYWAGLNTYSAIVTAWYHRLKTGEGQMIDASLLQNLLFNNNAILDYNIGSYKTRSGNHHPDYAPYGLFCGQDKQYAIVCVTENSDWVRLATMIGRSDLASLDNTERVARRTELTAAIEKWLVGFKDIRDAVALLQREKICACRESNMHDVTTDPHVLENKWLEEVALPDDIKTMRSWVTRNINATFSKTPGSAKPSPALGNATMEVLTEIGMQPDEIHALQKKWLEK